MQRPTHSYCRALYKYPQCPYPYQQLIDENGRRGRDQPEFELLDSGVFAEERYFDVSVEYAKATPTDILIRLTIANRGPQAADIHVLPTLWFRNTWSWGAIEEESTARPSISAGVNARLTAVHETLGTYHLAYEASKRRTRMPVYGQRTRIAHGYLEFPMSARMLRTRFTRPSF